MLGPTTDALLSPERRLEGPASRPCTGTRSGCSGSWGRSSTSLASSRAGRRPPSSSSISRALTADLASAFESAMDGAGLVYEVRCEPLPQPVYVDPDMWEKILLNLISNALKFTFEGRIRVSLAASRTTRSCSPWKTRARASRTTSCRTSSIAFIGCKGLARAPSKGSGIGLALVHELARIHGGTVAVKSDARGRHDLHRRHPDENDAGRRRRAARRADGARPRRSPLRSSKRRFDGCRTPISLGPSAAAIDAGARRDSDPTRPGRSDACSSSTTTPTCATT